MEKKVIALLVFSVTFLVSLSLSEKILKGEEVKKLFKDVEEKGKEFFDDISFEEINEYMRDKLNLLLTYLRNNPENGKSDDKTRKVKKIGTQDGITDSGSGSESTDENESEEDNDDFKQENKKRICDESDSDEGCRISEQIRNGKASESGVSGVCYSQEDPSCGGINGRTETRLWSEGREQDMRTVSDIESPLVDETLTKHLVETSSVESANEIYSPTDEIIEISNTVPHDFKTYIKYEEGSIAVDENVKEMTKEKGNITSETLSVSDNSAEASINVPVSLEDKDLSDTMMSDVETGLDDKLTTNIQDEINHSNVFDTLQGSNEQDFQTTETPRNVDTANYDELLEDKSDEELLDVGGDQSSGTSIKLEPSESNLTNANSPTDLNLNILETGTNTVSEEQVSNVGNKKYKIEKQEYEYRSKSYKILTRPVLASAHTDTRSSIHSKDVNSGEKDTPYVDVIETQTGELSETSNEFDRAAYEAEDISSDSDTNLNNIPHDTDFKSPSSYESEENTHVEKEGGTSIVDEIRKIEKTFVSKIRHKLLDTLNLDSIIQSPVSLFSRVKSSSTETPEFKDVIDKIIHDLRRDEEELEPISYTNALENYISEKLDKYITEKLSPVLKSEWNRFVKKTADKDRGDVMSDRKGSFFSVLVDELLLFSEQKNKPDAVAPAGEIHSENLLESSENTPKYSSIKVQISESDGISEIELSNGMYDYKRLETESHSDLPESDESRTAGISETLDEQQENVVTDNLKYKEMISHHSLDDNPQAESVAPWGQQQSDKKTSHHLLNEPSTHGDGKDSLRRPEDEL